MMPQHHLMSTARVSSFLAVLFTLFASRAVASDLRFSHAITGAERTASGLTKLTSDQVAVIDAFVRRDTTARGAPVDTSAPASADEKVKPVPATFSQRLEARERSTAGLGSLSAMEVAQLDALVDRHQNAKLARTLLAPPVFLSRSKIEPSETEKKRQIHGSYSLSFGWGSGGYSERTGSMMLNFEDPVKGYSISVGYTESHIKGGNGVYLDPYYRDPLYRDPLYRDGVYDSQGLSLGVGIARP